LVVVEVAAIACRINSSSISMLVRINAPQCVSMARFVCIGNANTLQPAVLNKDKKKLAGQES